MIEVSWMEAQGYFTAKAEKVGRGNQRGDWLVKGVLQKKKEETGNEHNWFALLYCLTVIMFACTGIAKKNNPGTEQEREREGGKGSETRQRNRIEKRAGLT